MYDVYENTVRFEEADPQGVVFYGNYATYLDETVLAYFTEVGVPYDSMRSAGWDVQVVSIELTYHASAGVGDRLRNSIRTTAVGNSSITFEYCCRAAETDRTLVKGTVVHVVVKDNGDSMRVPDTLREAINDFQDKTIASGQ